MSEVTVRFGMVIRSHRQGRGLSQGALAALADVDRSYLGEIERGAVSPSIDTIHKLANALGENLSDLLRECEIGNS